MFEYPTSSRPIVSPSSGNLLNGAIIHLGMRPYFLMPLSLANSGNIVSDCRCRRHFRSRVSSNSDLVRRQRLLASLSAQQVREVQQLLLTAVHPQQVMTLRQWADLNSLGYSSARRILASGQGPKITQLSERRIGIRVADNDKWQATRVRSGK